jgi:spore germination protein GerM
MLLMTLLGWFQPSAFGRKGDQHRDVNRALKRRYAVHLYFSDRQMQYLTAEKRELLCDVDDVSLGKCILTTLIEGPQSNLINALPKGTTLKAFFITDDGTAYVEFNSAISRNHPGGVRSELLTVFAVVNSLTLNLSKVNRVQILIDGGLHETLAGHIVIADPYKANILLIR